MTSKQVEEILKTSRFADEADRKYWEDKLIALRIKESTTKENEKYFEKMRVYDR